MEEAKKGGREEGRKGGKEETWAGEKGRQRGRASYQVPTVTVAPASARALAMAQP